MAALEMFVMIVYGVTALIGASGGIVWMVSPRFRREILGERRSPRD